MSRAFRLGVFIVVALLAFGIGVFWIGSNQMMFRSRYKLYAEFPNVAGLAGGAEVRVAGIRKGVVEQIFLPQGPGRKVRVRMELDTETNRVIKKDSQASINAEGLMGDEYIEVSVGSNDAPRVRENDTLQGAQPMEISDLIRKAGGILDTADGAMQNVDSITAKINQGSGTMGALINDKKVYQNVNRASAELQEDMEALKHNFLLSRFFHKRGYEDSADLAKNAIDNLPPEDKAVKRFSWRAQDLFDKPDGAKLRNDKTLGQAGAYLQSYPFGMAVVAGYSDMKGDSTDEQTLTQARAMVVRDYLVKNFKMDDKRVKTIGFGKSPEAEASGVAVLVYPPDIAPAVSNGVSHRPSGVSSAQNTPAGRR